MWARWEVLKSPNSAGVAKGLCFDLESAYPTTDPSSETLFGQIYEIFARVHKLREQPFQADSDCWPDAALYPRDIQPAESRQQSLDIKDEEWTSDAKTLFDLYFFRPPDRWPAEMQQIQFQDHICFRYEPFYSLISALKST
jgi:hypothetical protein